MQGNVAIWERGVTSMRTSSIQPVSEVERGKRSARSVRCGAKPWFGYGFSGFARLSRWIAWLAVCLSFALLTACASVGGPGLHHGLTFTPQSTPVYDLSFRYGSLKDLAATRKAMGFSDGPTRWNRTLGSYQIPEFLYLDWRTEQGQIRNEKIPVLELLRGESRSDLVEMDLEILFRDARVELRVDYRPQLKRPKKLIYANP